MNVALLAIDPQNDFLGDGPSFFVAKRNNVIQSFVEQTRSSTSSGPVFVKSVYYGGRPLALSLHLHEKQRKGFAVNSSFQAGTYVGKEACCYR